MAIKNFRVLHVAETVKGGIATYLNNLVYIQSTAFESNSVFLIYPENHISSLILTKEVTPLAYKSTRNRFINSLIVCIRTLNAVREIKPNVVHMHSTFSGLLLKPLLNLFYPNVIRVYCPHGWAFDKKLNLITKKVYVYVERLFSVFDNAIICISDHEKEMALLNGYSSSKLHVVINGLADTTETAAPDLPEWRQKCLRVLFVGRFDYQKGIDILAKAAILTNNDVHFIVAGEAVVNDSVPVVFPSNVTCIGWKTTLQLSSYYKSADVLVVPSRWEGFGLVAIEAMRASTAVIASNVGGLAGIVKDGVTGFLVENESPEAIAKALKKCTKGEWKLMGLAGRDLYIKKYTIDRVHTELLSIYGV